MKQKTENSVQKAIRILGGRWKPVILFFLKDETYRFGELQRKIPNVSQKMLTQQLRELENNGVIHREVYKQVPPKVEYSITDYGKTAIPILKKISDWGQIHQNESPSFPKDLKQVCDS